MSTENNINPKTFKNKTTSNFVIEEINKTSNFDDNNNLNNINTNNLINEKKNLSFLFTSEKAGMQGLDREQINKIILESTKDSVITKNKTEEFQKVVKIVEDYKLKLENLHKNSLIWEQNKKLAEIKLKEIERTRDTSKIWLHLDMDMFYAAVEIRDNPRLKDLPVAIGDERMIATSNYIARKFGVRSAMPGFLGKKLCPNLVFVDSKKIMEILKFYDINIDIRGLDEAFLDITKFCKENYITKDSELSDLTKEIKKKILTETNLTCSIGISSNKMLSKICSDINKPDGMYILLPKNELELIEFMKDLNVRKIPFVGEKMEQKLNLLGIKTCNDILDKFVELFYIFQDNQFEFLITSCLGIGSCHHEELKENVNKSISCSESFKMTNDIKIISWIFDNLVKRLYKSMVKEEVIGKNLNVEIKDKQDKVMSKSISLKKYFETENEIKSNGYNLLMGMIKNNSVRLIRLKLANLTQINPEVLKKKKDNPILKWVEKMNINKNNLEQENNNLSKKNNLNEKNNFSKKNYSILDFSPLKIKEEILEDSRKDIYKSENINNFISSTNKEKSNIIEIDKFDVKNILDKNENFSEKKSSNIGIEIKREIIRIPNQRNLNEDSKKKSPLKKRKKDYNNIPNNFMDINNMILNMKNENLINVSKKSEEKNSIEIFNNSNKIKDTKLSKININEEENKNLAYFEKNKIDKKEKEILAINSVENKINISENLKNKNICNEINTKKPRRKKNDGVSSDKKINNQFRIDNFFIHN